MNFVIQIAHKQTVQLGKRCRFVSRSSAEIEVIDSPVLPRQIVLVY